MSFPDQYPAGDRACNRLRAGYALPRSYLSRSRAERAEEAFVAKPLGVSLLLALGGLASSAQIAALGLSWFWAYPAAIWLPLAARAIGMYFLVQGILFVHREATAPYVNDANDNASGITVAVALFDELAARPVDGWEISLVLTGAEEGAQSAPPPPQYCPVTAFTSVNSTRAPWRTGRMPRGDFLLSEDL